MLAAQSPNIYLLLIVLVLVFGIGAVMLGRRSRTSPPPSTPPPATPSARTAPTITKDEDTTAIGVVETEPAPIDAETLDEGGVEEVHTITVGEKIEKSRGVFAKAFASIRGRGRIDQEAWDDLEETLLRADVGVGVADSLLTTLKDAVQTQGLSSPDELVESLRRTMKGQLDASDRSLRIEADNSPSIWLFVGVNGVGKTTTIGKLGAAKTAEGLKVLMAAGDTFRAAAAEQLQTWAERSGAEFVRGSEGGDPASVIYDGVQAAGARGVQLVLADTAGRLQNKQNLMDELKKVRRVADRGPGAVTEVLLVIDATTGQNGLSQAREFAAATDVTGVVLTKLDGSAKGGIVFAIETTLGIPVKLVGLGEGINDLVAFDPDEFVDALVG